VTKKFSLGSYQLPIKCFFGEVINSGYLTVEFPGRRGDIPDLPVTSFFGN